MNNYSKRVFLACITVLVVGGGVIFDALAENTAGDSLKHWTDHVIPLPKEINVKGTLTVAPDRIHVVPFDSAVPQIKTAVELLHRFAKGDEKDSRIAITMTLAKDGAFALPGKMKDRLLTLPNKDQAYAILSFPESGNKVCLVIAANTPTGLLYGCRTLSQLIKASEKTGADTRLEIPLADVTDWPDMDGRGQWGDGAVEDMEWSSQWKLNLIDEDAMNHVNRDSGNPEIRIKSELIQKAALFGVEIVPFIPHLGSLAVATAREDKTKRFLPALAVQDSSKHGYAWYQRGFCMSSPVTIELLSVWLEEMAELIKGYSNDLMVWLSEDRTPCFCEKCKGQDAFEVEVKGVLKAFAKVKGKYPNMRLLITTSQGSFSSNDKVLSHLPADAGVCYYHGGGGTYISDRNPMIYPLLEDYAMKGGRLGVYPQFVNDWITIAPWTGPQFVRFRAQEFVDKKLDFICGYFVTRARYYHEYNLMAMAEWTWNANGRTPEEFSRAYATVTGIAAPDLFSRWAMKAGEAGWDLAESQLIAILVLGDSSELLKKPFDQKFEFSPLLDPDYYNKSLKTAKAALEIARETNTPSMINESEFTLASLEAFGLLRSVCGTFQESMRYYKGKSYKLSKPEKERVSKDLNRLDRCAHVVRLNIFEWEKNVRNKMIPMPPMHRRTRWSALSLLRACDALREEAVKCGIPDPRPESRPVELGKWSVRDLPKGNGSRKLDLTDFIAREGGSYIIQFKSFDGFYPVNVKKIIVQGLDPLTSKCNIYYESPPEPWGNWPIVEGKGEVGESEIITVPKTQPGTKLYLEVNLLAYPVPDPDKFAEKDPNNSGAISIRRVWNKGAEPVWDTVGSDLKKCLIGPARRCEQEKGV